MTLPSGSTLRWELEGIHQLVMKANPCLPRGALARLRAQGTVVPNLLYYD
jgi:hypothetical protein